MKAFIRTFVLLCLIGPGRLEAASRPGDAAATPFERAHGYRERTILAKPRAQHRATVDGDEFRERVRVRDRYPRLADLRVIEIEADETVDGAVARLQATGRYEFVERDIIMSEDAVPNDPGFANQWALNNTGQLTGSTVGVDIKAVSAWDTISEAPNVIVAMIDNGVRIDHEDFAPNLWRNPAPTFGDINGARFIRGVRSGDVRDDSGHGSHTAGIVAAAGNNGVGTTGVAWRVQLMVLKNAGADGLSSASDSSACVSYAIAHGADVINCSFGGSGFSQAFFSALRAARDAGVIVVCSAGNSGANTDTTPHYPGNYLLDNIVTVGNSNAADTANSTSNFGVVVDLFAPGTSITSVDFTTTTGSVSRSGTSMAAPHVTGSLALLKARFPTDSYRQLINRLLRGTEVKTSLADRAQTNGRLDLQRALNATTSRPYNDDLVTRFRITGSILAARANNTGATVESGEPAHAEVTPTGTLWWQWVAPSAGPYILDTAGSGYDTTVAVYSSSNTTAPTFSTLTAIASNDDSGTLTTSRLTFEATSGASYFIAVSGKAGGNGYTQMSLATAPAHDFFANALVLSGDSAQATARNSSGSLEPGEPSILGFPGGASMWYRWTAPRNARYQISAFTNDFDPVLAVYTGGSLGTLSLVTSNDDTNSGPGITNPGSRCTLNAIAGTTYYIQADTKNGTTRGQVIVTLTDSAWQMSTDGGEITASPAVAPDGTIYIGAISPDRRIYAVAPDGALKWTYSTGGNIDIGSVAIASDGTLYQGAFDGKLVALTPSGTLKWTHDFGTNNSVAVTPAIGPDGTIYIHAADGHLYALDPANGARKWRFNASTGSTFAGAAVAPDGTIYQGSNDQSLYALNPDGTLKWRFPAGGTASSTPALDASGNIYYSTSITPAAGTTPSSTPQLFAIAPNGTQRWVYDGFTASVSSSPALSADGATLYIGGGDRRLHAVDTANGAARWTYTLGNTVFASSPAVDSNGVIYIGASDGKLYAVTPGGALRRTWDLAMSVRSSPAIFGTTLYLGGRDAKLYAFDIGASAAGGPWPQYAQNPRHSGRVMTDALAISAQPVPLQGNAGQPATFHGAALGRGPLTYQWNRDGVAIPGATQSTYTVPSVSTTTVGQYTLTVTGPQGTTTSSAARLTLGAAFTGGRLINLSILTSLSAAGETFTMGFVVGGAGTNGTKPLLIRAAGPALAAFNVAGTLEDPKLELFGGTAKTSENDNWGGGSVLANAFAAVGAFAYGSGTSRDAATLADVSAGDNSVRVSATGNGTGLVIAELYDSTPAATFTGSTPRLVNVSVLKHLGGGLTVGFVIGGSTSKTVLVRAIGPTLAGAPFGVSGVVADPTLTLYSGQTVIGSNDNWGGTSALAAAFSQVGAFVLPAGSRDAALLAPLQPGNYTVQVAAVNNTTGVALVEVYEVP